MRNHIGVFAFSALGPEDLEQVTELERSVFPTPWTQEQYAVLLDSGICKIFGARADGRLAGYIAVALPPAAEELEIYNIAVAPAYRRQGLGLALLEQLLAAAVLLGVRRILLEVRESNIPAVRLYEKTGFTVCGRRKKYYDAPVEDAVLYECLVPGLPQS